MRFLPFTWHVCWCHPCSDLVWAAMLLRVHLCSFPGVSTRCNFTADALFFWLLTLPLSPCVHLLCDLYFKDVGLFSAFSLYDLIYPHTLKASFWQFLNCVNRLDSFSEFQTHIFKYLLTSLWTSPRHFKLKLTKIVIFLNLISPSLYHFNTRVPNSSSLSSFISHYSSHPSPIPVISTFKISLVSCLNDYCFLLHLE